MEPSGHVRKAHRRARAEAIALALLGVGTTIVGLWAIGTGPPAALVWLITLVIFGPILVFTALIGYYTHLETLDADRYAHDDFQAPETALPPGGA